MRCVALRGRGCALQRELTQPTPLSRVCCGGRRIYCNSEFTVSSDGTPQFVSVVDVVHSMLGDDGACDGGRVTRAGCDEYVHVLWGMSKDFGVSGCVSWRAVACGRDACACDGAAVVAANPPGSASGPSTLTMLR